MGTEFEADCDEPKDMLEVYLEYCEMEFWELMPEKTSKIST
jgi:hypothetical protein